MALTYKEIEVEYDKLTDNEKRNVVELMMDTANDKMFTVDELQKRTTPAAIEHYIHRIKRILNKPESE